MDSEFIHSFNSSQISPANETFLLIGGVLTFTMLFGIVLSGLLLVICIRFKSARTPFNNVIFIMTAFNLLSWVQFPFFIHSHFARNFFFNLTYKDLNYSNILVKPQPMRYFNGFFSKEFLRRFNFFDYNMNTGVRY